MRSYLLVIFTAIGLAGLFMAYWTIQPAGRLADASTAPKVIARPKANDHQRLKGMGAGDSAWLKEFDERGQLSSEFKGREYLPQTDGTIRVIEPVGKFFLAGRQHIEVHGRDGNVVVKDAPDLNRTGFGNPGPLGPPNRGRLNDVTVDLIDEAEPDPQKAKVLTMRTNNVVFDNDTFRISTEGYRDADGKFIPDDQVPVHVTGRYEFEGRGLTLRWNDKDGRLDLLEIAHGEYLKIKGKDASSFSPAGRDKPSARQAAPVAYLMGAPFPEMLAAKDKGAEQEIITSHPPPTTRSHRGGSARSPHGPNAPVVYRATFYDHVRINQPAAEGPGDQVLITGADRMDVDFIMKSSSQEPTTRPAAAVQPGLATTQPAVARPQPGAPPDAQPATQPVAAEAPPIWVRWTGVLRMTPLRSSPPVRLTPGDAAVTLVGAPVTIHRADPKQDGFEDIVCASALYQKEGENVWLYQSEQVRQVLVTRTPGAAAGEHGITRLVSSGIVHYSKSDLQVLLTGPGHSEVPLESKQKDQHPLLQAAWTQLARFDLAPAGADKQQTIRNGHFEGDVDIKHPQMALKSQSLDLLFDPPTRKTADAVDYENPKYRQDQPNLRQAIATTAVWCELEDTQGKKQTIECNRLVLDTAQSQGKLYARHVNATGAVHAYAQDDLRAEYVDLLLTPAVPGRSAPSDGTKPSDESQAGAVDLERTVARDHVRVRSKDGNTAVGDELVVTQDHGRQHTVLTSAADAMVTDPKSNWVRGRHIEFDPDQGKARLIGRGAMHVLQQPSATQPAEPVDLTWTERADFDSPANAIDVMGGVIARQIDSKGFVNTATGEHAHIELRKKPAPPSTQPILASATQPARKKSSGELVGGANSDLFRDKQVVTITLEKNAAIDSVLSDASGVEQQYKLFGPRIIIRELGPDGQPARSLIVPDAGKMLVRDHRAPEKQTTPDDSNGMGGSRGVTAFEWHKQLVYSERNRRADMTGNVLVVHQDEDLKQPPVRLTSEIVTAYFEPTAKRNAAAPNIPEANKPATQPAHNEAPSQLKYLQARGPQVIVTRDTMQMVARQVDYDPRKHVLVATGTDRNPVVFTNGGTGQTIAEQMDWDTITWNVKTRNAIIDYRPPVPPTPKGQEPKKPPIQDPNHTGRQYKTDKY